MEIFVKIRGNISPETGRYVRHDRPRQNIPGLLHQRVQCRLQNTPGTTIRHDNIHLITTVITHLRPVSHVSPHLSGRDMRYQHGSIIDMIMFQHVNMPPHNPVHLFLQSGINKCLTNLPSTLPVGPCQQMRGYTLRTIHLSG